MSVYNQLFIYWKQNNSRAPALFVGGWQIHKHKNYQKILNG